MKLPNDIGINIVAAAWTLRQFSGYKDVASKALDIYPKGIRSFQLRLGGSGDSKGEAAGGFPFRRCGVQHHDLINFKEVLLHMALTKDDA
ncbi:hypothetical protein JQC92_22410 [Shewanella sp. 202IG2-18]|uniref:hypothetical protein n=1 Tax=Parashewanella hymeniacidonis TaxID=2807618 RepID=UPI0019601F0C|nr:hypothetical protein [Parashewanella hymeniacidonis]MBM7074725.1 hypothetical protein [Parashewanella hymeniacidonis]